MNLMGYCLSNQKILRLVGHFEEIVTFSIGGSRAPSPFGPISFIFM